MKQILTWPGDPAWLRTWAKRLKIPRNKNEAMRLAIELADESAAQAGGPFGAILTTQKLELVALGWNGVVALKDSTAHAEIMAIRRAQKSLKVYSLSKLPARKFWLFSSCAPCIQCFGAIYWSGISCVYSAAPAEAAKAIGFDEGPVSRSLWLNAKKMRQIDYRPNFGRNKKSLAILKNYRREGGIIY